MKSQLLIFKNYLIDFNSKFLIGNSYAEQAFNSEGDTLKAVYVSHKYQTRLSISLCDFQDGRFYVQTTMHKYESGKYGDRKFFALSDFLEGHKEIEFKDICKYEENFDDFAKTYFLNLKNAFETYLHGYLIGEFAEEHDPSAGYK